MPWWYQWTHEPYKVHGSSIIFFFFRYEHIFGDIVWHATQLCHLQVDHVSVLCMQTKISGNQFFGG